MARKVLNRKALRQEAEAAEQQAEAPKKTAKKAATKRASRAKAPEDIPKKLCWGVYTQALKRVALFDFSQKKAAEKKAEELNKSGKTPHIVLKVKEPIVEE